MTPQARSFKRAAIHACRLKNFFFSKFMGERGLEAILIDADQKGYTAQEIATHVLAECCVTNGKFNNFEVGFLAVMKFLSDQFGEPHLGQLQAYRDLVAILNGGGSFPAIMGWLKTHYP